MSKYLLFRAYLDLVRTAPTRSLLEKFSNEAEHLINQSFDFGFDELFALYQVKNKRFDELTLGIFEYAQDCEAFESATFTKLPVCSVLCTESAVQAKPARSFFTRNGIKSHLRIKQIFAIRFFRVASGTGGVI